MLVDRNVIMDSSLFILLLEIVSIWAVPRSHPLFLLLVITPLFLLFFRLRLPF